MTVVDLWAVDRDCAQADAVLSDTTDTELIAAPGAGRQIFVTGVYATNSHDTVGTDVAFRKDTTDFFSHWAEQTGGGFGFAYATPIPWGDNVSLKVQASASGNAYVQVTYYIGGV